MKIKKIAIAAIVASSLFGNAAHAALMTTSVQSQQYVGKAGNKSGSFGVSPFSFAKFDASLGSLLGVFAKLTFNISGGLISADNLTNKVTSGTGELGASASVSSSVPFVSSSFVPMFSGFELSQLASFTLAADPLLTIGGSGPDVFTMHGGAYSMDSGWQMLATMFQTPLIGTGNFVVNFDTNSDVIINAVGARGSFEAVDADLKMELYYQYEGAAPAPVDARYGMVGLLALAGLMTRRRSLKK